VNANVLMYLGETSGTRRTIGYLLKMFRDGSEDKEIVFYAHRMSLYYFASRAYFTGVKALEAAKPMSIDHASRRKPPIGAILVLVLAGFLYAGMIACLTDYQSGGEDAFGRGLSRAEAKTVAQEFRAAGARGGAVEGIGYAALAGNAIVEFGSAELKRDVLPKLDAHLCRDPAQAERMRHWFAPPKSKVDVWPHTGHWIMQDRKDDVNAAVTAWIDAL